MSSDDKDADNKRDPMQDFIDDFEKLMKKHKIEKYLTIINSDENQPILLYRPNDIIEITRVLKVTHNRFFNELMRQVGEINQ